MRLILDTQAFLWLIADDPRLSPRAKAVALDPSTRAYVSLASVWEVAIKSRLGKLPLPAPAHPYLRDRLIASNIGLIPIRYLDAVSVATLPLHHGDPFDRLIVAQTLRHNLPIVGKDKQFDAYGVTRIW